MNVLDDRVVHLASFNYSDGVLNEPRVYFDVITPEPVPLGSLNVEYTGKGSLSYGDPDAFVNREEYPIWLSHMTAQILQKSVKSSEGNAEVIIGDDRRELAGVGLQWRPHNGYYMSQKTFASIPQWQNVDNGLSRDTPKTSVTWKFDKPIVYSSRDTLHVEVGMMLGAHISLQRTIAEVYVTFSGTGMLSGRPYYFGASAMLLRENENSTLVLDPAVLRNAGSEPVSLDTMTVRGDDIYNMDIQVHQDGNGTNMDWFQGPSIPVNRPRCPIALLGAHAGQAVIHRFPGRGVLLEPGEGLTPVLQTLFSGIDRIVAPGSFLNQTAAPDIGLALSGYLMVT